MTPLEPHGRNGGAGLVATSLVTHLSALDPASRYTLLTADDSHAELASLDAANVQRQCVGKRSESPMIARKLLDSVLPAEARVRVKRAYRWLRNGRTRTHVADDLGPDLLLCPFTVPHFWRSGVPCISIVYDLQHLSYPEFFSTEQRLNRQRHIADAVARSSRVVCISEYVRQTLLANTQVGAEQAVTIPLGLLHEHDSADPSIVHRLGLEPRQFLLYPANFWPHKNHRRLFEGLCMHRQAHPNSRVRLVCTGAPNELMRALKEEAPPELVVFPGYVNEHELGGLMDACAALIFPSLYEGFGMPVVEAMARGRPVLCSRVTSLPEVAGDAAVYFDPDEPRQIARAIDALQDESAMAELVRRGQQRAARMGTGRELAARYLQLFDEVLGQPNGA
jgi:glycosyltransferase involved in cell wall biosynthesis